MSKRAREKTKLANKKRNDFLLTFFQRVAVPEVQVNGFWLVKQYDRANDVWNVSVLTSEGYVLYQKSAAEYQKRKAGLEE